MECPQCGLTNPPGITACTACSTPLPISDRTLTITSSVTPNAAVASDRTMDDVSGWSAPATAGGAGSSRTLEPGRMLGNRYEILLMLGEGGMGAVYKARDRELDRLIALKVIRPELAQNPDIFQRFKQEILLSSRVTHRNVVRIYDLGDAEGLKFITMEYVDGKDLRQTLNQHGRLGVNEAVDIIGQVFSGLAAAHREGIVHRDLK